MTISINEILARPAYKACGPRGADMGRRNQTQGQPEKLYLQRVAFVDECYDRGGAYWGSPQDLWCAFSPDDTKNDELVMVFVRAGDRQAAKRRVLALLPPGDWSFFR